MSAATVTADISLFPILGAMIISTIFALSLISIKMQSILESRVLCYFGFISYPLYLIHENAMISMIIKLGHLFPSVPGYLYPIIPVIILTGTAYLVVKYAEPFVKKGIVTMISNPILKRI
jgi:peptidoglycan/LPS O-acetylase OafA/YrhL